MGDYHVGLHHQGHRSMVGCMELGSMGATNMEFPGKIIPKRLYKYRSFSNLTLDLLISDHIYYASPSTFNDPLDTRPSLKIDVDVVELEKILTHFVERRTEAEMNAAAKIMKYRHIRHNQFSMSASSRTVTCSLRRGQTGAVVSQ